MSTIKRANVLIPVLDCCVHHPDYGLGVVRNNKGAENSGIVAVFWFNDQEAGVCPVEDLRCGFRPGHTVQDVPRSNARKPLGMGTVREIRTIAGREQVSVQLNDTGEYRSLPFENLRLLSGANDKYALGESGGLDSAERFQLKALAFALDSWNQATGALDRLDVDPLPHQIDLVHRIMTSDQTNWLIADDVGLGKTIEVGLLLAALKRRRLARRVLIVCPAGIVRQWQQEMHEKFNETYRIYGLDFHIPNASHWASYDKVIASIDMAKAHRHKALFENTDYWDVVVIDEAHHLSKIQGQAVTQRYQLAASLRGLTDAMIFLTGTPHQGNHEQFVNLLMLLRPDLRRSLSAIFSDPSVIAEVILRNRKSLVTDANGNFLFRGQDTRLVDVPLSAVAKTFADELQQYLKYGYAASEQGGNSGRAIGFVMTTYRKLASSSIAAIATALNRRNSRLSSVSHGDGSPTSLQFGDDFFSDDAFLDGTDGRDDMDQVADIAANPFFDNERDQITRLIQLAAEVQNDDRKLRQFLTEIVDPLFEQGERLLIFAEYRATQDYLVEKINHRYPDAGVTQINGSMSIAHKRASIDEFNESAQFMVSTEAGGEGVNLHQRCHILVNYDLPWNPSRLVQRAGRLYRYGQNERVIVFNLMANDGFDNQTLNVMLNRVFRIAQDMAPVGAEYQEGLREEIIGELLDRVDMGRILAVNKTMDIDRTEKEIENAVDLATRSKSQQEQLFSHIEGYDPTKTAVLGSFGLADTLRFLEAILPYKNVQVRNRLYNGRLLELELPPDMRGSFPEFGDRTVVRVTVDRQLSAQLRDVVPVDFASDFFSYLVLFAQSPEFKGEYARVRGLSPGTLALFRLRWQNDQGVPLSDELLPVFLPQGSENPSVEPELFSALLSATVPTAESPHLSTRDERNNQLSLLKQRAEQELADKCTKFRHPNDVVLLATADIDGPSGS